MRQRTPLFALALFALLIALPAAPPRAARAATLNGSFGINSNIASRHPIYETIEQPADAVAALGAGWVREDFQFFRLQPEPGRFDWSWNDRMVDLFSARGVQIIGLLNGPSPGWATGRGGPSFFPPDPAQFAA
ncbi:MAG: hypothetical protein HGA45_32430, partial [Chloroflexales bacterium]|nr:hypothetical protein [Chloroflexales bacterium]